MSIKVTVIKDSTTCKGDRLFTALWEYPRYIHAEVLRHRMLSHSVSSSRAIPVSRMLDQVSNDPATPIYWGEEKAGMSATSQVEDTRQVQDLWQGAARSAVQQAKQLQALNLHKQVTNRLVEPFQTIIEVVTGTDYNNFLHLRLDKHAQPEICALAVALHDAMEGSTPEILEEGQYHLPYIDSLLVRDGTIRYTVEGNTLTDLHEAIKVSMSLIAQTSYRTLDISVKKANIIHDKLMGGKIKHVSPSEHIATPFMQDEYELREDLVSVFVKELKHRYGSEVAGTMAEHIMYCGNLRGWTQLRKTYDGETLSTPIRQETVENARSRW